MRRTAALLAIVAALLGAPSPLLADSPDLLPPPDGATAHPDPTSAVAPADPTPVPAHTPAPEQVPPTPPAAPVATSLPAPANSEVRRSGAVPSSSPEAAPDKPSPVLVAGGGVPSGDGAAAPRVSARPTLGLAPGPPLDATGGTTDTNVMLLLVVVSVAAVGLLGTGWLLAARDRSDDRTKVRLRRSGRLSETAAQAAAIETRRARRRAALEGGPDPVLAALGLDDAHDPLPHRPEDGSRAKPPTPRRGPRG